MSDLKYIKAYESYSNNDAVTDAFKEALFLSKGATNNRFAYEAAQAGLPAALIVEYYANLSDDGTSKCKRVINSSHEIKKNHKRADRQARRAFKKLSNILDTPYGRRCKEKYGEAKVKRMLGISGVYSDSIIPTDRDAAAEFHAVIASAPMDVYNYWNHKKAYVNEMQRPVLKALASISDSDVKKLETKHLNVEKIADHVDRCSDNAQFRQDFANAFAYEVSSYANIPQELLKAAKMLPDAGDELTDEYNECALIPYCASIGMHVNSYNYGIEMQPGKYCSLLFNGLYAAMKELGVGIFPNKVWAANSSSRVPKFNKIAKKVIKLNEQYQKAIKAKNNTIEPAVIRQTIVGMFNEYSNRLGLYYTMFEREDMPAPTLESMQPKKKTSKKSSTKTAKTSTKKSALRKETAEVVVDGVKFYSYN